MSDIIPIEKTLKGITMVDKGESLKSLAFDYGVSENNWMVDVKSSKLENFSS